MVQKLDITKILGSTQSTGSTSTANIDKILMQALTGGYSVDNKSFGNVQQSENKFIQKVKSTVKELITSLTLGEDANAAKKTADGEKKIEQNTKTATETYTNLSDKLQTIMTQCNTNADEIKSILEELKKLGGEDDGKIAETQKKLDEQLEIIDTNKNILNNPDAKPEERKSALSAILGAASQINALVEEIKSYSDLITENGNRVVALQDENTDLTNQANEEMCQGIDKIKEAIAAAGKLTAEEAAKEAESVTFTTAGTSQVAMGNSMEAGSVFTLGATAVTGAQYIAAGNDKISAGATEMQGSIKNISQLTQSIGDFNGFLNCLNDFSNGIGKFNYGFSDLIGAYNSTVTPMITAIGSIDETVSANDELQEYVQNYASTVTGENVEMNEDGVYEIGKGNEDNENKNTQLRGLQFEFDTNIFKRA